MARLPSRSSDMLWPVPTESWSRSPLLTDLWPWQHSGVQWKRSWPIGETEAVLAERWRRLTSSSQTERAELFRETRDRRIDSRYPRLSGGGPRLPSISSLAATEPAPSFARYGFRSFDRRWVLFDNRLGIISADRCGKHAAPTVVMTSLLTGVLGFGASATVSEMPPDLHHFRGSFGGKTSSRFGATLPAHSLIFLLLTRCSARISGCCRRRRFLCVHICHPQRAVLRGDILGRTDGAWTTHSGDP